MSLDENGAWARDRLRWTLNLCVFHQPSRDLVLHAAVVERDGRALIMPAVPGSGKSTLLRTLNGLQSVDSGKITIAGVEVTNSKTDIFSCWAKEAKFLPCQSRFVR